MTTNESGTFNIALVQMTMSTDTKNNVVNAKKAIMSAAKKNADLCILPELFTNRYVGQFEDVKSVLAQLPNHEPIIEEFKEISKDASIATVVPHVEIIDNDSRYNSEVLIDRKGKIIAHYRKLHIPYGPGYHEDYYFKPGDQGYAVADLGRIKIGLGICWDQWFPEFSRILALKGAQLIVYPSAIGSEIAVPSHDSHPSWEHVIRAQAIMNRVFVAAVNRVGKEEVIDFYGGSFVADPWGKVIKRASLTKPGIIIASLDLSQISNAISFFGFLETRRPDTYADLTREDIVPLHKRDRPKKGD
ncbi:MAG: N-carbamoylputrescine amidase [Thermoplasmata archaeon]|nr:N-carbamoylputrescine amidase [Thermoplasmata archaeon]